MPWPKGRPCSPETRRKISIALVGNQLALGNKLRPDKTRTKDPARVALQRSHPEHRQYFIDMLRRAKQFRLACDFPNTATGFQDFVDHIGPRPGHMLKPAVGRKDHSQGYVLGNIGWQAFAENSRESAIRNNSGEVGRRNFALRWSR